MLPKSIYQLLPYIYISISLLCVLVVESSLIFFPSAVLIMAATLVFWMRYKNAVNPAKYIDLTKTAPERESDLLFDQSADIIDHERRLDDKRVFPLLDDNGAMIAFDRRRQQAC